MNRNTARAIERHKLTILQVGDYQVYAGKLSPGDTSYGDGVRAHLRYNDPQSKGAAQPRQAWGYSEGRTIDSAVEDWCNARNLQYEREP